MDFLGLTTTAQIRNVLTVDESDLSDEVIDGFGLDDDLAVALTLAVPSWATLTEDLHLRLLRLAAKYYCAGTLARMAPVFILVKDTDGSNEGQRKDKDSYQWLSSTLLGKAAEYLDTLLEDLGQAPVVGVYKMFSASRPTRDPITEPRQ